MENLVFADTSGLVAKFVESDGCHAAADRTMRDLIAAGRRLLTTDFIFDEIVTRVRTIAPHEDAVAAGERILNSPRVIQLVEVDRALRGEAWIIFKKFKDQEFSFTDCTSFAAMKKFGIAEAFTFDSDFRKAGFTVMPSRKGR